MRQLRFGKGNAKLGREITTFSLPAGWTCPGARECLSKARDGRLTDGEHTRFRCFAASQEAMYSSAAKSRWANLEALKGLEVAGMAALISESLAKDAQIVRVHVSGDFFSEAYFRAWMEVARQRPQTLFYAYTKSLKLWVENRDLVPANFRLIASKGGKWDHYIKTYALRYAEVVFSGEQAARLGLEIDHDDSLAYGSDQSFALLLHGIQPKGSQAAKALSALRAAGQGGYSRQARDKYSRRIKQTPAAAVA